MERIRIRSCFSQDVTVISNRFLDRFLPNANGDFVKIYLYLLRAASTHSDAHSLSSIADRMNCTENDVRRALKYWEKEGILQLGFTDDGQLTDIAFTSYCNPGSVPGEAATASVGQNSSDAMPKSSDITTERMAELGQREDIRELFFIAQQYIRKPLTRSEMQKICFFYDTLKMTPELIAYLIEYSVSRNHTSFRYMEKVALAWHEEGITNEREARVQAESYHREYYDILKALGINNHHPVEAEIKIMKKWLEKYRFSMELIGEACSRTVMNTSKPTLNYADGILSRWNTAGVKTLQDVEALDAEHEKSSASARKTGAAGNKAAKNSYSDFEQRTYDFDDLEARLLDN